eukprot:gnl/TRDRNA2_/TRDRNA2_176434_c4_seq18.p1 gnl/TRDRNA2_/TRDRNA2_176434_c4~~gnl/TRDRNA2_/TRDRNA2_176434_c4_seq18.p1  ORF type:complete len:264 (-),score=33.84 gnl/TRDRNA2_/TRDRNA2_176434_c4_seq18:178-969(-)
MCFGSCGRSPGWCSMCFVTKLTAACPPRPSRHMRLELTARCIVLGMPLLSLHAAKLVERGKEYTWRAVRQEAWGIYEEYDGPCHFCGLIDDEPPEPVAKEDKWIGFRKSVERVKTSFCRENIAETNMHDLTVKDKETDPWNIRNGLREGVLRGGNRCCSSVKSPDKKLRLRLPGESGTFMAMSDADGMVTKAHTYGAQMQFNLATTVHRAKHTARSKAIRQGRWLAKATGCVEAIVKQLAAIRTTCTVPAAVERSCRHMIDVQ